ncbi:hypothetical protein MYX75_06100, partial [Acidobacteria bacterium AH-259-A15]|nr:hypothetical protein [Acidobacteria bacterium AH-259-A15]
MKIEKTLAALVVVLAFISSALGQINITSTPVKATATGMAELLGKITVKVGGAGLVGEEVTVDFGVNIVNTLGATGIRAANCTGSFDGRGATAGACSGKTATTTDDVSVAATAQNLKDGIVKITVPALTAAGTGSSFDLIGVRVDIAGKSGELKAKVKPTANAIFVEGIPGNEVVVVDSIEPGMIVDRESTSVLTIENAGVTIPQIFRISEGFESAFTDDVGTFGQTVATRVRIRVQGLPPDSTVTFPETVSDSAATLTARDLEGCVDVPADVGKECFLTLPTSKGDTFIEYRFSGGSSSRVETFNIKYTLEVKTAPPDSVVMFLQVSLFPSDASSIPRYSTQFIPTEDELPFPEFDGFLPILFTEGQFMGVAFTNPADFELSVKLEAISRDGTSIQGADIVNPNSLTLPAQGQQSALVKEIFGTAVLSAELGTIVAQTRRARAPSLFLLGDNNSTFIDGGTGVERAFRTFVLPNVSRDGMSPFTKIHVFNPSTEGDTELELRLRDTSGATVALRTLNLAPRETLSENLTALLQVNVGALGGGYVEGVASRQIIALESFGNEQTINVLSAQAAFHTEVYWIPHFAVGGGFDTELNIINTEAIGESILQLTAFDDEGNPLSSALQISLQPGEQTIFSIIALFEEPPTQLVAGSIRIQVEPIFLGPFKSVPGLNGSVRFKSQDGRLSSALPLLLKSGTSALYSHVAQDLGFFTGVAVLNPQSDPVDVTVEVFDQNALQVGSKTLTLPAGGRQARLLVELIPQVIGQLGGYFRVRADASVISFALFGDFAGELI